MLRIIFFWIAGFGLAIAPFFAGTITSHGSSAVTFSDDLQAFAAMEPVDTHAHAYKLDPAFFAMLQRLHLHLLDISVPNKDDPEFADIEARTRAAEMFVLGSNGHATLCTTFDPFKFSSPGFPKEAVRKLNEDFAQGAVAVKIWKNIGMELQNTKGQFVLPDDPRFEPIYRDIEAHGKTLIAHVADPDSCWQPPNKASPDYGYFKQHPEWYMYTKPDHPSKAAIIQARDHMVEENPKLRVVGAHLGSLESDVDLVAQRLDRYPNFAVDMAARVVYFAIQPREKVRQFLIKYQDRVLYATDLGFHLNSNTEEAEKAWEKRYATDWKFFSSNSRMEYQGRETQGLGLPDQVLRKLFHDNAVHWIPGVIPQSAAGK